MQIKTILNRIQKHRGFVYGTVQLDEQIAGLALTIAIAAHRRNRPRCAGCGATGSVYDRLAPRRFEFVPLWGLRVFFLYMMRRLGLVIRSGAGRAGDSSGRGVEVRTTVAADVVLGSVRFRDVSFLVVDREEPLGILGMPIISAIGRVQWSADGVWDVGRPSAVGDAERNLVFFENKLLIATTVLSQRVFGTLDTGATTTDLNSHFAAQFPSAMPKDAKPVTKTIEGLGGKSVFDAFILPEVMFHVGRTPVALRPAQMTRQLNEGIGGTCCVGNIGLDVVTKTGRLDLNLNTMRLSLE